MWLINLFPKEKKRQSQIRIQGNTKKKKKNIEKEGKSDFLKWHVRNRRKSPIQAALEFPNCTRAKDAPPTSPCRPC